MSDIQDSKKVEIKQTAAKSTKNWGFWIGLAVSIGWIGSIAWWQIISEWCTASAMKPSEWGDFAAGLAAPLAFAWLVAGYKQQGRELQQNTEALQQQGQALKMQVCELRNSVEQQTALVKTAQKQQAADVAKLQLPNLQECRTLVENHLVPDSVTYVKNRCNKLNTESIPIELPDIAQKLINDLLRNFEATILKPEINFGPELCSDYLKRLPQLYREAAEVATDRIQEHLTAKKLKPLKYIEKPEIIQLALAEFQTADVVAMELHRKVLGQFDDEIKKCRGVLFNMGE